MRGDASSIHDATPRVQAEFVGIKNHPSAFAINSIFRLFP